MENKHVIGIAIIVSFCFGMVMGAFLLNRNKLYTTPSNGVYTKSQCESLTKGDTIFVYSFYSDSIEKYVVTKNHTEIGVVETLNDKTISYNSLIKK